MFNEASTLLSLTASSAVVLPLSDLSHADSSSFPLPADLSSPFETSALLSSHLTSVLMPLRSKVDRGRMGMSELVSGLNWRGDTRMTGLEGSVPVWDVESANKAKWDFSTFRKEAKEGEKPVRPSSVGRNLSLSLCLVSDGTPPFYFLFFLLG